MNTTSDQSSSFNSLSVTDLLYARELFHSHLSHMERVVATAIGRYRRRADGVPPDAPKTLANTEVSGWSWPCILIFVDEWLDATEPHRPESFIPPYLYLPDGRSAPTCVIQVEEIPAAPAIPEMMTFPSQMVGGGYPVLTTVQGRTHFASIGCLVSDGHTTYALTNAHVVGEAGEPVETIFTGKSRPLGASDAKHLSKKRFDAVYEKWPYPNSYVNMDAGLIRIDDLDHWTTQVYGIGELGMLKDLNTDTYSLRLVGQPVRAFGASSGLLKGEIAALFYRYRSVGGFDYVADLLIGPRRGDAEAMSAKQGDSGTIWLLEEAPSGSMGEKHGQLRPIALQWGGHQIVTAEADGGSQERKFNFALATALSTVCRELDVDIVRDWNTGHPETWGPIGHYLIGARACTAVTNKKLQTLLKSNAARISVTDDDIKTRNLNKQVGFVALADVADIVWRKMGTHPFRPLDGHNHFADMDRPGQVEPFKGKNLFDLTPAADKLDIATWNAFYDAFSEDESDKGTLPFRVWQVYDAMVDFVKAGDVRSYVCAAGVLAHYLGDACQPLHVSRFHHGYFVNEGSQDAAHPLPAHIKLEREIDVHSLFEQEMLEGTATAELIDLVNQQLATKKLPRTRIASGRAAGFASITLMSKVFGILPPTDVVDFYNDHFTEPNRRRVMWAGLKDRAAKCMAEGVITLAAIWQGAWVTGGGSKISNLAEVDAAFLQATYETRDFLKSVNLKNLAQSGLLKM